MITDWQIQSFSRKCAHSEKVFKTGDHVLCLLVDHLSDGLGRMDVLEEFVDELSTDGEIVGRWVRTIKEPDSSDAEARKQETLTVEELFISMAESIEVSIRSNSTKCMIYILSLFLERKRILRSIVTRGIPQNYLHFRHIKSKKEYLIEQIEMTPENIAHIENNLNILTGEAPSHESKSEAEPEK